MSEKRYAENWWIVQKLGKQRYLLASLITLLILLPLLVSPDTSRFWLLWVLTLIMVTGPLSIATRRIDLIRTLALGVLMTSTSWMGAFVEHSVLDTVIVGSTMIFFAMLGGLIFRQYLFGDHDVNMETLIAAVNAYLCIGIMYAFAYIYMMQADPGSFSGTFMDSAEFEAFVYLSFVTMTTLGYGDIAPRTEFAAVLTYSQAVVGQLFVALTIARIVGIIVAKEVAQLARGGEDDTLP